MLTTKTSGGRVSVIALQILLCGLGALAISISTSMLLFGAAFTAGGGARAYSALSGLGGAIGEAWSPTVDSELRFYAVLFLAFGILTWRAGTKIHLHLPHVPWLAGVFFLGGAGRALSWIVTGPPHPFFLFLMAGELVLPLVIAPLWMVCRGATQSQGSEAAK